MNYLHVLIYKYELFPILIFYLILYHISEENIMDNKKLLGKRIKEIRKNCNFTQEELAERVNIDITTLSGIESGRHFPSLVTLEKIANALNVSMITLFDYKHFVPIEDMRIFIGKNTDLLSDEDVKFVYKLLNKKYVD